MSICFTPSLSLKARTAFATNSSAGAACSRRSNVGSPVVTPRAQLSKLPPPGIPSGDSVDGESIQSYSPNPETSYERRSFTTNLPQTWAGEITSVSVTDFEEDSTASKLAREIQVSDESTAAFAEYSEMVKNEREAALAEQARRSSAPASGRATCGEEEGRAVVSNFLTQYLDGVKCVEYWGAPNGPVPKLFGGPSQ